MDCDKTHITKIKILRIYVARTGSSLDIISAHDAIYFEFDIPVNTVNQVDKPVIASVSVQNKKLLWEKANIHLYQETLETLENFE